MIRNFYDLDAWQKARLFVSVIYEITKVFPKEEMYGLTCQIKRAVLSICANIAEGFGRYYFNDKVRFYYQARGSLQEVQNFLMLAMDLGFVSREKYIELFKMSIEVAKLINGLIKSAKEQNN